MEKTITYRLIQVLVLSITISCSTDPTAKIQGVYEVNKESLKELLQKQIEVENAISLGLLNVAVENSVFEFCIKGDSINGILFLAGETILLNSQIIVRNDSLIIDIGEAEAYLIPKETGISYKVIGADIAIDLIKTDRTELSKETKDVILAQMKVIKEKEEFEKNLGTWRVGNYVDEFGDKTGEGFAYCIIRGTHENSISVESEVYVKATIQNEKLFIQIYNSSLDMKESFPDKEFGSIKLKFPDGSVESERVFFYENSASESPSDERNILYDYISKNDGIIKVFIDLSTASDYFSDKYQFAIARNNLSEVLKGIK